MQSTTGKPENQWIIQLEGDLQFDFTDCVGLVPSFKDLSEEPFIEMDQLEAGTIANPDENRMVGHYWLRDPDLAPDKLYSEQIRQSWQQIKSLADDILVGKVKSQSNRKFRDVLWLGIGGSALGPQLIVDAVGEGNLTFYFFDNTDTHGALRKLARLSSLQESLVVVVSKSGGTRETSNVLHLLTRCFESQGLSLSQNAIAITQPESQLDLIASREQWIASIPLWDWVGGRTSIWSAVGLLPLALMGVDFQQFLQGAASMDTVTRKHCWTSNPAALMALTLYSSKQHSKTSDLVILPYRDRLCLLGRYLQQLIMESLGKGQDRAGDPIEEGIAVYGNKGSTDQHAFVQQLRDGKRDFIAVFIEVLKDEYPVPAFLGEVDISKACNLEGGAMIDDHLFGFLHGTRSALRVAGRENLLISIDQFSPGSMGALIAFFERVVGFYASLVNINAYHQPGVEAGKRSAEEILELQARVMALLNSQKTPLSIDEIVDRFSESSSKDVIPALLHRLSVNGRIASTTSGPDGIAYSRLKP